MKKSEKQALIKKLEKEMKEAAKDFDFEKAIELRNILYEMKGS